MYATYTLAASFTQANVLSDLVKIFTGETNVSNLSSSCNQPSSSILTSYSAAGWTVWDAAAGANFQVLRAPWDASNGSGYNYIGIGTNTAGVVTITSYEYWNNTTHVGTNAVTSNSPRYGASSVLYLYANQGHSLCVNCFFGGYWGCDTSYYSPHMSLERTRTEPWDLLTMSYPVISTMNGMFQGSSYLSFARAPMIGGADAYNPGMAFSSFASISSNFRLSTSYAPATTIPSDAAKTLAHTFFPLWNAYSSNNSNIVGGDCSILSEVWITTTNFGSSLDEVVCGGVTYVIWTIASSTGTGNGGRFALRKG